MTASDVATITTKRGHVVLIDAIDLDLVNQYHWTTSFSGRDTTYAVAYIRINQRSQPVFMHRLLTDAPKGLCVDHINRNGLDNRRGNLRLASNSQNQANRRLGRNNTSGFRGVYFSIERQKWQSRIVVNQKGIELGRFEDIKDAARAYDRAAIAAFGSYASLNFPLEANE